MAIIKLFSGIVALLFLLNGTAMAGCKLSDFTPDNLDLSKSSSRRGNIISATTSSTFGSTTYGFAKMSSTSGCGRRGRAHLQQEHFLLHNKIYLLADISRGSGEYLSSFSQLMGCSSEVQGQFAGTMQSQLDQLMPATPLPGKILLNRIHTISAAHPDLSRECVYTG